jgi:hypothetical protein
LPIDGESEHWRSLCEQAATEQDLGRLLQLVREINRELIEWLLQEKDRLNLIRFDKSPTFRADK